MLKAVALTYAGSKSASRSYPDNWTCTDGCMVYIIARSAFAGALLYIPGFNQVIGT